MIQTIMKAPCARLNKIQTLFIEMTGQNCNLRCKNCYIDFKDKHPKDFIPFEKIQKALSDINLNDLEYICFTGAEPMMHPDFNKILRLCLQYSSTMIYTNALNINDKKARFLKKVEEENTKGHEIIFLISIDKPDEKENDLIRGRGAYRKAIHALQSLIKYEFNPILSTVNYDNRPEEEIKNEFKELCSSFNFETTDINFKILPYMKQDAPNEPAEFLSEPQTECTKSRTLTINGVFSCPMLASDNRGKCGSDFTDYEKRCYLETTYCNQCAKFNKGLFGFDFV